MIKATIEFFFQNKNNHILTYNGPYCQMKISRKAVWRVDGKLDPFQKKCHFLFSKSSESFWKHVIEVFETFFFPLMSTEMIEYHRRAIMWNVNFFVVLRSHLFTCQFQAVDKQGQNFQKTIPSVFVEVFRMTWSNFDGWIEHCREIVNWTRSTIRT